MAFITEFIKHPRRIGAVAPSGKGLARAMMEPIDFAAAQVIVEYGPGTGAFTRELLTRRRAGTTLVLIEQNDTFYHALKEKWGEQPDMYIIHGTAGDVNEHLARLGLPGPDHIVSSLPFTSLPQEASDAVLTATQRVIGGGKFITFQYSRVKFAYLERFFTLAECRRVLVNLPPAYVLVMKDR